jgi:hypothetical protein
MTNYFIAVKLRLSHLRSPYDRNEKFIKLSDRQSHRKRKPRRFIYILVHGMIPLIQTIWITNSRLWYFLSKNTLPSRYYWEKKYSQFFDNFSKFSPKLYIIMSSTIIFQDVKIVICSILSLIWKLWKKFLFNRLLIRYKIRTLQQIDGLLRECNKISWNILR